MRLRQIDVSRINAKIKMIAERGHRLESKTHSTLDFPKLIMGLCQRARIPLSAVVHETIDGVVDVREPHVDHILPSRDAFRQHANWPEGMPFYSEGETEEEEEIKEIEEDED
ncbi:hypothetical protein KIW84_071873 [Lathyrus oleraceus]|uniref:Uncharacterized protein n=1 Tax=Pisum sativum TaxID=3888 RepID=A0A9D4VLE0_PEA|nr:hypothetical protein KIW84_071873 [Pisum sativum]